MAAPIAPVTLANPITAIQSPIAAAPGASAVQGNRVPLHVRKSSEHGRRIFRPVRIAQSKTSSMEIMKDVHTAVLATQRADLSFELFMQVRNKVVSAYQELMRMQV